MGKNAFEIKDVDAFCKWAHKKMEDKNAKCSLNGLKCYPSFADEACKKCYLKEKGERHG